MDGLFTGLLPGHPPGHGESQGHVLQDGFVENNYKMFADKAVSEYVLFFLGIQDNILFRAVNKLSGQRLRKYIIRNTIAKRGLGMKNYTECEAHRELLLKGLEQKE